MNLKSKFLFIYRGWIIVAIVGLVIGSATLALTAFFIMMAAFIVWNVLRRRQNPARKQTTAIDT
jgi:hypothetical protein